MVEYIDDIHTYLVNGVIVPSVTQLLQFKFPDKYNNVPENILKEKAEYGSKVHKLVEILNNSDNFYNIIESVEIFDYIIASSLKQYVKLYEKFNIEILKQEQIVFNDVIAGRYDMLANINSKKTLVDIKTTAVLDKEYLSWQLSIYNYLNKEKVNNLGSIWLPKKGLGKYTEIDFKSDIEIEKLINEWRKENE